jgi:DNA-binding NarL/FixJ family response regulator
VRLIRVVVADDDTVFRRALVDVLEIDPRFQVVAETATGADLGPVVVAARADLVLLDVRMPQGGPVAARAVTEATAGWSRSPVLVVVSADSTLHTVVSMVRAGVSGYLVKGRIGSSLGELLMRCVDGEVVLAVPRALDVFDRLARTPVPEKTDAGVRWA